jgi:predicted RNase H-like HicB family nuclease
LLSEPSRMLFTGDTIDEALENIKEAIQACLESLAEDELKSYLTKPSAKVVEVVA